MSWVSSTPCDGHHRPAQRSPIFADAICEEARRLPEAGHVGHSRYGGEQTLGAQEGGGWEGQSIPVRAPVLCPQQPEQQHLEC